MLNKKPKRRLSSSPNVVAHNFNVVTAMNENRLMHEKIKEKSLTLSRKIKTQKKLRPFYNQIRVFSKRQYKRRSYRKILINGWYPNGTLSQKKMEPSEKHLLTSKINQTYRENSKMQSETMR